MEDIKELFVLYNQFLCKTDTAPKNGLVIKILHMGLKKRILQVCLCHKYRFLNPQMWTEVDQAIHMWFYMYTIDIFMYLHTAKSLQSCPTLCDPIDGSPQAPPSLGFSRQEHWNGLPFPSAMHESEKWKGSCSIVSDSSRPHGLQPTRLLRPWDFPGKSTGVGCHCLHILNK